MAGRQSFAVTIYGVSAADQHVHGWDARRASHVTGFMAAPTSRCQLDLILFLIGVYTGRILPKEVILRSACLSEFAHVQDKTPLLVAAVSGPLGGCASD
jgi:hypothetical protein